MIYLKQETQNLTREQSPDKGSLLSCLLIRNPITSFIATDEGEITLTLTWVSSEFPPTISLLPLAEGSVALGFAEAGARSTEQALFSLPQSHPCSVANI